MLLATRLGFARLMRFVSASVMSGFMFGVGLILILGQLADATGVTTSGGSTLEKALNTLRQWQSFDRASVLTAAAAIGISIILGRGKMGGPGTPGRDRDPRRGPHRDRRATSPPWPRPQGPSPSACRPWSCPTSG